MANNADVKVLDLLSQMKKSGAKVLKTHGSTKSKVVKATASRAKMKPQEFGAWISWTKSF